MTSNETTQYYHWKNYNCAYTQYNFENQNNDFALLLIHPIGVGLSGVFWQRFINFWQNNNQNISIFNPDLLGCGKSDYPSIAYYPEDWANQLEFFIQNIIKKPVVLVIQGALFPVGIYLIDKMKKSNLIKGVILSCPPGWNIITYQPKKWQLKLSWNLLFNSPIGNLFYLYAKRRKFIEKFSKNKLFANNNSVDNEWLNTLEKDAKNNKSRYSVYSFLAGFWREDYTQSIRQITQPTLFLIGDKATNISKRGLQETPQERLELYQQNLPNAKLKIIKGRNVLPYESTEEFGKEVIDFVNNLY